MNVGPCLMDHGHLPDNCLHCLAEERRILAKWQQGACRPLVSLLRHLDARTARGFEGWPDFAITEHFELSQLVETLLLSGPGDSTGGVT